LAIREFALPATPWTISVSRHVYVNARLDSSRNEIRNEIGEVIMSTPQAAQVSGEIPLPAVLFQMITGSWVSQTIHVAAKLGIADRLVDGGKSSDELAESTGAHAASLYRVLRALASLGIFVERDPGFFEMTPMSEYLRTGVPGSMRAAAIMFGEEWHYRPWGQVLHSVKTGQTAFSHLFGQEAFPYLAANEAASTIFNEAMTGASSVGNAAVAAAYDFSNAGRVVDVAGGHGSLIAEILKANPAVQGILFDQPSVVAGAKSLLKAAGLMDRCEIDGGDFFEAVPRGGAVYIVKYIIHDWDDDRALMILKNVHRAMDAGSKILLVENVIKPGNDPCPGKVLDIEMLVLAGGRERTEQEYRALFAVAGFELTKIIPTQTTLSLIEGVKA
jgi:O-methyltransferase domain/Dimerisation domain